MRHRKLATVALASCLGVMSSAARGQVAAFPGAEGYGAATPGGRGGQVIEVTSLADSGPGSFRAAVQAPGPRIVVFRVGGTILLSSEIRISQPNLTIAGQTAPGGGIALRGNGISVQTHDVVIRGLRIRPGEATSPTEGLELLGSNVIVDHCTVSWAVDENMSTWYELANITVQWTIVSEALYDANHDKGPHSMGLLLGGGAEGVARRVSLHHNLLAHNNQRNPRIQGNTDLELVNNVIYDWGQIGSQISGGASGPTINLISNLAKPGPSSGDGPWIRLDAAPAQGIYVEGNIGPGRATLSDPEWGIVGSNASAQRGTPWPASPNPITVTPYPDFVEQVLSCVGASAPVRDSADARLVQEVRDGTGRIIDSPSQVGGWPELAAGMAPADSDHDGMPDDWERARGLDPGAAADGNTLAPSGYTWVEEHINSLFGDCGTALGTAPPAVPPATGTGGQAAAGMPQPQAGGGASVPVPLSGVGSPAPEGVPSGAGSGGASAGTGATEAAAMPSSFVPSRARSERSASGCSAPSGTSRATPWSTVLVALLALAARKAKSRATSLGQRGGCRVRGQAPNLRCPALRGRLDAAKSALVLLGATLGSPAVLTACSADIRSVASTAGAHAPSVRDAATPSARPDAGPGVGADRSGSGPDVTSSERDAAPDVDTSVDGSVPSSGSLDGGRGLGVDSGPSPQQTFQARTKKAILFSGGGGTTGLVFAHDLVDPERVAHLDGLPIDGVCVRPFSPARAGNYSNGFMPLFEPRVWREDELEMAELAAIPWGRVRENLLETYTQADYVVDWFDDAQWKIITDNMKLLSRALKAGRMKGLLFDVEYYGEWNTPPLWDHQTYADRSRSDLDAKVRQRGQELMEALQTAVDSVTFLSVYANYSDGWYSMIPVFAEGVLSVAKPGGKFVDGHEYAYYASETRRYYDYYERVVDTDVRSMFPNTYQVGFPFYWNALSGRGGYDASFTDEYQSQWMSHAYYYGSLVSDEYLWIFTEGVNWVKDPMDELTRVVLEEARGKLQGGQALGFDMARPSGSDWNAWRTAAEIRTSPQVRITSPPNDEHVQADQAIHVEVSLDSGNASRMELFVNSLSQAVDDTPPFSFELPSLAAGSHTLVVRAFDGDAHNSSNPVTIDVGN